MCIIKSISHMEHKFCNFAFYNNYAKLRKIQGCGSSDRFRNQPQLPFILFTTLNTARDFPTQNDSEFIIVSLTGRPHYKSRVVFRTVFSENHGHDAGIADFFLLVSCFSMLPLIFLMSFV